MSALPTSLGVLLEEMAAEEAFSGVVILREHGQPLFEGAYGFANRAWQMANTVDTRFRLASVSKLFTAVAVLQLVEQGLIAPDTPVAARLGLEASQISPAVTVAHLLTMTAGIADWFEESGNWVATWEALRREYPLYLFRENADYLPLFVDKPPLAPVGERYRYNNANYILLGLLVERASERSYFDYVRTHIFAPARMAGSDFLALDEVAENVAEGYIPIRGDGEEIAGWKRNIYQVTAFPAADGGATAPAADLFRFMEALRDGTLLSETSTEALFRPHGIETETEYRGYRWEYGYGFQFLRDGAGAIVRYGKTGEEDGVSCRLYHYPARALDVVILGNQSQCAGELGWQIHDLIVEDR